MAEGLVLTESKRSAKIITQMFRALLPAQILSLMTNSLSSIINGLLVGNFLEPEAMVALGFVVPMSMLLCGLSTIISGGARVLCGRCKGRGDVKGLDCTFSVSVAMSVILGGVLTVAALCFSVPLARLFGAAGDTTAATATYIRGLAFGFIPSIMIPSLMVFLQTGNESNYAFYSAVVLAVCSLVFSFVAITAFELGVFGMGIASSLSQYVAMLFLLRRFRKNKALMKFDFAGIKNDLIRLTVKLGSPAALSMILYSMRNVMLNSIGLRFGGTVSVSALAILNSVGGVFDAFNTGVGAVALMLASVFVGERDFESLRLLLRSTLKIGLLLAAAKVAVIAVFGKGIVLMFGAEGDIVDEAFGLLLCYGLNMPVNILMQTLIPPYQSLGRVKYLNVIYIFAAFVIPVGFCLLACPIIGTKAIWLCYFVADFLCLVILTVHSMRKRGHFPRSAEDWLVIEDDFSDGVKLNISVRSIEEIINISEKIIDFCRKNGVRAKESMFCGLCMEEMAVNIVEHGFPKSKRKDNEIDLFMSIDDDGINMRIRDNAKEFDPHVKLQNPDPDDPCRNVGIRLVSKLASEMNYQSCFGMNVLTIKLSDKV